MSDNSNQISPENIKQLGSLDQLLNTAVRDIVKAQNDLAMAQMNLILENCFKKNGDTFEPVMIDIAVSPNKTPGLPVNSPVGEQQTLNLPLLTVMPLSSLNMDRVTLDFNLDADMINILPLQDNEPQFMVKTIETPEGNAEASITALQEKNRLRLTVELNQLPLSNDVNAIIKAFTGKER